MLVSRRTAACCLCAFEDLKRNISAVFSLTFDSHLVPFHISFQAFFASCRITHLQLDRVCVASFLSQHLLKLFLASAARSDVRCLIGDFRLQLVDLLQEGKLLVLLLANSALELCPVLLLVQSDRLECLELVGKLVPFI